MFTTQHGNTFSIISSNMIKDLCRIMLLTTRKSFSQIVKRPLEAPIDLENARSKFSLPIIVVQQIYLYLPILFLEHNIYQVSLFNELEKKILFNKPPPSSNIPGYDLYRTILIQQVTTTEVESKTNYLFASLSSSRGYSVAYILIIVLNIPT